MSKKISKVDKYDFSAQALWNMMADPAYLEGKYEALQDISFEVVDHKSDADSLNIQVSRVVPADLPEVAKKVLGDTNQLIQKENWKRNGDNYECDLDIETPGKPVKITGKLKIVPTGDASADWHVDMEIKASVPIIGGKIEGAVEKETRGKLDLEYQYNCQYLENQ